MSQTRMIRIVLTTTIRTKFGVHTTQDVFEVAPNRPSYQFSDFGRIYWRDGRVTREDGRTPVPGWSCTIEDVQD